MDEKDRATNGPSNASMLSDLMVGNQGIEIVDIQQNAAPQTDMW